jgi:hypothetical protein
METRGYRRFFETRCELARWIIIEKGKGFEADAEIILCCALGALATKLWPGLRIDRQRFTQLLIDFSPTQFNLKLISTPVLAWQLRDQGDTSTSINLATHFFPGHPTEDLQPALVDQEDTVVFAAFPHLDRKSIRRASYASVIYSDLRSGLVHEYDFSGPITSMALSDKISRPSYLNITYEDGQTRRLLHLPFEFILTVLSAVAESLLSYWENASEYEKSRPPSWWVDG